MSDITLVVSAPGPTVELTADAPGAVTVTVSEGGGVSTHAGLPDLASSGHPASAIAFTPTGSIAATTVQAAVAEVASDAAAAYQPVDSDLTAIAALSTTAFGRAFLALADAAAGRTALGLGTASTAASGDFQPIDSDLTAIAALSTTSYGRAFLALADAAAGRTALGLGGAATLEVGTSAGTVAAGNDSRFLASALKASNLSDLTNTSEARTNLGLGDSATKNVGTSAGTVAAGDDSRITGAVPKSTVTTAGDLIYGTGNAAVSRLGLGSAGQVLTAGASAPTWAAASGAALSVPLATYTGGTQLVGVPGERFINFTAQSYSSNTDRYTAFSVQKAITVSDVLFSVSTGPASDATMYVAIYNATNGWQPTGSPVWSSSTAVATGFTGTKTFSSLGLALPAGNYVTAMNPSVTMSLAIGYSGAPAVVASNFQAPFCYQVVRTAAAFTSSPSEWNNLGMNVSQWHVLMMKWT